MPQLLQASRETCLKRTLSVLKKGQTNVSGSFSTACSLRNQRVLAEQQHFAFYYTTFVWKVEKFGDRPLAKTKLFPLSVPSCSSSLLDLVIFPDPLSPPSTNSSLQVDVESWPVSTDGVQALSKLGHKGCPQHPLPIYIGEFVST